MLKEMGAVKSYLLIEVSLVNPFSRPIGTPKMRPLTAAILRRSCRSSKMTAQLVGTWGSIRYVPSRLSQVRFEHCSNDSGC